MGVMRRRMRRRAIVGGAAAAPPTIARRLMRRLIIPIRIPFPPHRPVSKGNPEELPKPDPRRLPSTGND